MIKKTFLAATLAAIPMAAHAEIDHSQMDHSQHKGHHLYHNGHADTAPAGVMGTHLHETGKFMLSYNYMNMDMHGPRSGQSRVDVTDVHAAGFMVAPIDMTTEMHMFGGMYGLNSNWTIMGMLPYVKKSMNLRTMGGAHFQTKSKGWGDLKVTALTNGNNWKNWILGLGISLPTGATDKRDDTPMMANMKLPYPMQIGSGSYEFLPSVTYQCDCNDKYFVGAQAKATIRVTEAKEDYTLGNQYKANVWVGRKVNEELSTTIRAEYDFIENIDGRDAQISTTMSPMGNPDMQARQRINIGLGVNYAPKNLDGVQFLVEAKMPVFEDVDGYGLEMDNTLMFKVRKTF